MKQLLLSLIFIATATIANAQTCPDETWTSTTLNANGDISCCKGNECRTFDSQATATAKAQAQAAADAQAQATATAIANNKAIHQQMQAVKDDMILQEAQIAIANNGGTVATPTVSTSMAKTAGTVATPATDPNDALESDYTTYQSLQAQLTNASN